MSANKILLSELVFDKKPVISVDSETKLEEVAEILKKNNILSVPVFDKSQNRFIGIIDVLDICRGTSIGMFEQKIYEDQYYEKWEFQLSTAGQLLSQSSRGKICVFEPTETLEAAMKELGQSYHRLLIAEQDNLANKSSYRLLSQTDIVRYLQKNAEKLGLKESAARPIEEHGLANPTGGGVITISTKQPALDGFRKMYEEKVSAVAVVDDKGVLVANLSASDLRGITSQKLKSLNAPVLEFLEKMHGIQPAHPVTCNSKYLLSEVWDQVLGAKVHRSWVCDAAQQPTGVVTLTDIIGACLS